MEPQVITKPLGANPPESKLYYGINVIEGLKLLADNSVHCICTSPPYFGLRDYETELAVWDATDPDCGHEWGEGNKCIKCGAWLGQLGLETAPADFVRHIVQVFREAKRVLRPDGTLWLNMGDSYAGSGGYSPDSPSNQNGSLQSGSRGSKKGGIKVTDGLKPKDLIGVPWRIALALQDDGWYLRSDIVWSKCLGATSVLYARGQKGTQPAMLKDLARLDPATVELWNGSDWTKVVRWERTTVPDAIVLELRSGECIPCTKDHRWPVENKGLVVASDLQIGDVLATTVLPDNPLKKDCALDADVGWFVGVYLAEGSKGKSGTVLQFAGHRREQTRFARLSAIAGRFDGTCRMHPTSENGVIVNLYGPTLVGIIDTYISGTDASTKHLHPRAWKRSNSFLKTLVEGYLHGDGHHDEDNGRHRLGFCRNLQLARDLRTLAARLGATLTLKPTESKMQERSFPSFRGEWRWERSGHFNEKSRSEIVNIRPAQGKVFYDVEVEDEPHLFALASGVLTHNSNPMPEPVKDRPTKAHEYIFLMAHPDSGGKYFYDVDAVREPMSEVTKQRDKYGFTGAFKGQFKGTPGEERFQQGKPIEDSSFYNERGRNKRTVWPVTVKSYKGAHFATWPEKLVEPMVKAATSEKGVCGECGAPWKRIAEKGEEDRWEPTCECGASSPVVKATVLDTFSGSATTGQVAMDLNRNYVGIDLRDDYLGLAQARLRGVKPPDITDTEDATTCFEEDW